MKRALLLVVQLIVALVISYIHAAEAPAQAKPKRAGVLMSQGDDVAKWFPYFLQVLADQGWVEGKNVTFEYRAGHGDPSQITRGLTQLVEQNVDLLIAIGPPAVRAAHAAAPSIPTVAHDLEADPVAEGYAQSYSHPGGNLTGLFLDTPELATKWIDLIKSIVPGMSRAAVLMDPSSGVAHLHAVKQVAQVLGVKLEIIELHTAEDIDSAASKIRHHPQALIILPSPLVYSQSAKLAKLARLQRLPATSMFRAFAEAGGLMSYGPSPAETEGQLAVLSAKVLSGADPADLPIERPSKFRLILNLKAAKALSIQVPDSLLLRADEVIQ